MSNDKLRRILDGLQSEAQWGLTNSHGGRQASHCNAQRALEIVVTIIRQLKGEDVPVPVSPHLYDALLTGPTIVLSQGGCTQNSGAIWLETAKAGKDSQ